MFYGIWIISSFIAVGVGCWVAHVVDKKDPEINKNN